VSVHGACNNNVFIFDSDTLTDVSSLQDVDEDNMRQIVIDEDDDNCGTDKYDLGDLTIPDFPVSDFIYIRSPITELINVTNSAGSVL